ncbi:MAG: Smr/MutS family protein [Myxococcales bacterium]|nr:Smr/MutS family protein [Myxococcales bacterium]
MGRQSKPARAPRPRVSPEDEALFLGAIDGAIPLAQRDRVPPMPVKTAVIPAAVLPPLQAMTLEGTDDEVSARAPGVNRAQLAELRRGSVRVEATLDLHGLTTAAAAPALERFLLESVRLRRRCVLVIHGKGLHSGGVATLRDLVIHHLSGPASGLVAAFCPARPAEGGTGASYVMVRA